MDLHGVDDHNLACLAMRIVCLRTVQPNWIRRVDDHREHRCLTQSSANQH